MGVAVVDQPRYTMSLEISHTGPSQQEGSPDATTQYIFSAFARVRTPYVPQKSSCFCGFSRTMRSARSVNPDQQSIFCSTLCQCRGLPLCSHSSGATGFRLMSAL